MSKATVWTHSQFQPEALALLAPVANVVTSSSKDLDAWYREAAAYDAIIVSGTMVLNGPVMDQIGPLLKIIARTGIGVDCIDADAATARGIMVINTPDGPTESTAEHAVALMMNLMKQVATSDRVLRSGAGFPPYGTLPKGLEAVGATLGLVGLGRIGGRVAEIARVLGMRVQAYDPFAAPERATALGVALVPSLDELLSQADVVSIHCPSIPETYHLINADTLAKMRPGSYLINVSRGAIVDEAALVDALRSGHLAGAGLDVYDPEPPAADNPLFSLPNTICTSHIGSYTETSVVRMQIMACEQVAMALRGVRPTTMVNPQVWERRRGASRMP